MSLTKTRLKILKRIAQAAGAPSAPANPMPATSNNIAVPPDPSPSASSLYPYLRAGFDANRITIVDQLCHILSTAANMATSGKYNLQNLRNKNFQFDPSEFADPNQKNLMVFFLKVFRTLLNSGEPFVAPVSAEQLKQMIPTLLQSQELSNLSQMSPTGQIAQKFPGNFKDNIRDLIARLQPTVPTRRA
jgi:hypothetical protein